MATMYDVAREAGVSIATVSAVVNKSSYVSPELTKRVKKAIKDLDYTVNHLAHSLQTRKTNTVGMLIPAEGSPDPFFGEVVRGAEDVFRKKDYLLMLGHTYNQPAEQARYLEAFRSRLVDGVLLFQTGADDDEELQRLLKEKRPVVFVGRVPSTAVGDVVATDIAAGTRMGMERLVARGHRRIGLIYIESSLSVAELRLKAWRASLERHGLPIDDALAVGGQFSAEAGRQAACQLLDLAEPPTAIFVDNLVLLTGVLRAFRERNVDAAKDIEIVSSDDADWLDVFSPPISTIVQPAYELGATAAEALLKRLRHPRRAPERIFLKPGFKARWQEPRPLSRP